MPQSKKTAPSKMSIPALIAEHRLYCDDPACEDKARRLAVKDRLHEIAIKEPMSEAAKYAAERCWCLHAAAA